MVKRVLIFTASTGAGHDQAAEAIHCNLAQKGLDVHVVNTLASCPKIYERLIENGYSIMANYMPKLYGGLYYFSHYRHPNHNLKKVFAHLFKDSMLKEIEAYQPDLMISTHPLYVNVLASLKQEQATQAALISVVTDLGVHRFYLHKEVDAYITGSTVTNAQLQALGIPAERLHSIGIPVKPEFYASLSYQGHPKQKPFSILVMAGSMGNYKLISVMDQLSKLKKNIKVHVVCGRNERLKNILVKRYGEINTFEIVGYCNDIDRLMTDADVLISKPGGITSTEALYRHLPLIIPFYINGQESENAMILSKLGVAIKLDKHQNLKHVIEGMLYDPTILEKLRQNIERVASQYSIEKLNALCLELCA
jgi:processive 1,2-diacylglycerol beta-glucosyltransferase